MRRKAWAVAVAATLALPGIAAAQGLGDAAKKEREKRTKGASPAAPKKVYTEEDIQGLPPLANEPGSPEGATPKAEAPAPGTPPRAPAEPKIVIPGLAREAEEPPASEEEARRRDEQRWRARVSEGRARIEKARTAYEFLSKLVLVPGYVYVDEHGQTVIDSIGQLQALTAGAKAELDAAEKALADLLEEARRAAVPPGWLR
jgi:hypothetical protein